MARRRPAKSHYSKSGRGARSTRTPTPLIRPVRLPPIYPSPRSVHRLLAYEDRRTNRARRSEPRTMTKTVRYQSPLKSLNASRIYFKPHRWALICIRRQRRREVLHATQRAGKRGQKAPKRNAFSKISC